MTTKTLTKKWKHFSDNNGNILKTIKVNGYDYGDRLLDGVMFNVSVNDKGKLEIKVIDEDADFFSDFNEKKWYNTILDDINENGEDNNIRDVNTGEIVFLVEDDNNTQTTSPSKNNNQSNIIANINSSIQTMNNGKTNITSNPDILGSLGIEEDVEDPSFVEYSTKMEEFKTSIQEKANEKDTELKTLNKYIDKNQYWEVFYNLELYNSILAKFFNKEYLTHPKIRLNKIKTFLDEILHKFTPYLESISYKIKTDEDVEAYEKEYLAKTLLTEFFPIVKEEKTETVDLKELGKNITDNTKTKLSEYLRKIEAGETLKKEEETLSLTELSEYDKADLKGKIAIKYAEVRRKAIQNDGEVDGIIKTYVESLYNPETTEYDNKNLLLNLLIVSRMLDFPVMKWEFDEKRVKVNNKEIELKHEWWNKILSEDIEEEMKWVKIVEKDLNLAFYQTFIFSLIKNADKLTYNERSIKMKKILSTVDEDTSRETLLLDTVLKKTHDGSILFITPDMEKYFQSENTVNEELGDKGQIRYIGVWSKRYIFVINTDNILTLKNYKREILCVNNGNSYVVNPEKPIVYFNALENNPFLERPMLKWFAGAEFDISMDKSLRLNVENEFMD